MKTQCQLETIDKDLEIHDRSLIGRDEDQCIVRVLKGCERQRPAKWGSVHMCEPHTYSKRANLALTCAFRPLIICYACGPHTHIIRYYKKSNPCVNAGLIFLLYVCEAHTLEPNPAKWSHFGMKPPAKAWQRVLVKKISIEDE